VIKKQDLVVSCLLSFVVSLDERQIAFSVVMRQQPHPKPNNIHNWLEDMDGNSKSYTTCIEAHASLKDMEIGSGSLLLPCR